MRALFCVVRKSLFGSVARPLFSLEVVWVFVVWVAPGGYDTIVGGV
jgi:hypothetical protein